MKKHETNKLAKQIRCYREEIGWSQSELARQAGITSAAVSMIEKGGRWPSLVVAKKIATVLHTSIENLMGEESLAVQQFKTIVFAARFWILDGLSPEDKAIIIMVAKRLLEGSVTGIKEE